MSNDADNPQAQLNAAVALVRAALAPDETLVLVGEDVVVSSQIRYSSGTYQVTTKLKEQAG